ncbi:hypothetical protein A464_1191 [Salmonella bongori N268-08]|uniref:Uncharacterized protein n=1 Tax=Salmonella bongori N268-08 TaxID=1197719 RepID=S5NDN0_SALBN|nr:hypothetical protein A464_1191 [Salmonella bongori N268-08]
MCLYWINCNTLFWRYFLPVTSKWEYYSSNDNIAALPLVAQKIDDNK